MLKLANEKWGKLTLLIPIHRLARETGTTGYSETCSIAIATYIHKYIIR